MTLKIGTRGSDLALWQANYLKAELKKAGIDSELVVVKTRGDKDLRPLKEIAGDSFFTKDLENMLLRNEVDLAIHSAKDMASMRHYQLPWKALGPRANTKDVLLLRKEYCIEDLPKLKIGTSSPRRRAQAALYHQGVETVELRGNVPTRLSKAETGELDGVLLAKAGMERIELLPLKSSDVQAIDLDWVTAPCQGILAVQGKQKALDKVSPILDEELTQIAMLEKAVLAFLGGGCHMAVGAKITPTADKQFQFDFYLKTKEDIQLNLSYPSLEDLSQFVFFEIHKAIVKAKNTNGKNLLTTSSLATQKSFMNEALKANHQVSSLPLSQISSDLDSKAFSEFIKKIDGSNGLIFTSQYSVRIFFMELYNQLGSIEKVENSKIFCVGEKTAQKVEEFGLVPETVQWEASAKGLSAFLNDAYPKSATFCFVGTENAQLPGEIKKFGFSLETLYVYKSHLPDWVQNGFKAPACDAIAFSSPSSVNQFFELYGTEALQNKKILAIGKSTAKELSKQNIVHIVSPKQGDWAEVLKEI